MTEISNDYSIRSIRRFDSRRIWEIRNHPDVRAYTNNPEEFDFASHVQWFEKKYFSGELNECFVLETANNARVIGYCRYDWEPEESYYIISIALDPDHHGHGLGHLLLSESLRQFNSKGKIRQPEGVALKKEGRLMIWAEIKRDNVRSIKLFGKNNFVNVGGNEWNCYFVHKP